MNKNEKQNVAAKRLEHLKTSKGMICIIDSWQIRKMIDDLKNQNEKMKVIIEREGHKMPDGHDEWENVTEVDMLMFKSKRDNKVDKIVSFSEEDLDIIDIIQGVYGYCDIDIDKAVSAALHFFDEHYWDFKLPSTEDIADNDKKEDFINHPSHYAHGMETIDEMILVFGKKAVANFCLCNVWKYRARSPFKGKPIEDIDKSNWYMAKYKELMSDIYEEEDEKPFTIVANKVKPSYKVENALC